MAAPRSSRVTRSSVGTNGLDETFCGRTLRNRSIAQPDEAPPPAPPRARSPKKKQDALQPGTQGGRVAEPWAAPRKRGLSCSEREGPERCGKGGGAQDSSPQPKRAKRCPRAGDAATIEDDTLPPKADGPTPCDLPTEGENDTNPFVHALATPSSPCEAGATQWAPPTEKVSNGVGETCVEDSQPVTVAMVSSASPAPSGIRKTVALLNGYQMAPSRDITTPDPTTPDPSVPCMNSLLEQEEVGSVSELTPPPALPQALSQPPTPVLAGQMEEEQVGAGDGVEEVVEDTVEDVGGVSVAHLVKDEILNGDDHFVVGRGTHGNEENNSVEHEHDSPKHNSGEPPPLLGHTLSPLSVSGTPPSFTEPQEHRYTLRTSPRRAAFGGGGAGGRTSPTPTSPPSRDNGPLKEEGVSPPLPLDEPPSATPLVEGPPESVACQSGVGADCRGARPTKEPTTGIYGGAEEGEEEEDVYYFESDHLALKQSQDYQRLLQTISVLEAQRTQAILDLESLARHQREALLDPISFVEELQKQVTLGLPCPQRVVQLPEISWEQYTSGLGDFEREFCHKKRKTRRLKLIFDRVGLSVRPKSPLDPKKEGESSALYSSLPSSDALEDSMQTQLIRGRLCHQSKPDTFNQLWTVEEQKKLEQLLLKFPPEEVESKRWQKIADELGNRTAKQVASRVQKYFIKLTKAGIPVPGRTPNLCMYSKKASSKRQHHLNKHLYRPSTFLTSYEPPVYMDDEDERASFFSSLQDATGEDSDEEGVPLECRHLPEYKELLELKRLKKQKLEEIQAEAGLAQHAGYKCDLCGMEPIQGVRWHCQDCPLDRAVDFCTNCSHCLFKTETHDPAHRLEPVYQTDSFLDQDYCLQDNTGYNYLDPNYFPANR